MTAEQFIAMWKHVRKSGYRVEFKDTGKVVCVIEEPPDDPRDGTAMKESSTVKKFCGNDWEDPIIAFERAYVEYHNS